MMTGGCQGIPPRALYNGGREGVIEEVGYDICMASSTDVVRAILLKLSPFGGTTLHLRSGIASRQTDKTKKAAVLGPLEWTAWPIMHP